MHIPLNPSFNLISYIIDYHNAKYLEFSYNVLRATALERWNILRSLQEL